MAPPDQAGQSGVTHLSPDYRPGGEACERAIFDAGRRLGRDYYGDDLFDTLVGLWETAYQSVLEDLMANRIAVDLNADP